MATGWVLGRSQKTNFAPRVGFAYQVTPKLVARGGFGLFYNAFENQGYGPNDGENYPFVFNFNWSSTNDYTALGSNPVENPNPWTGCPTAGPGGVAYFVVRVFLHSLSPPSAVNPAGLGLQGLSFDFKTPYTISQNLTLQYQINQLCRSGWRRSTPEGAIFQTGIGANKCQQILPAGTRHQRLHSVPGLRRRQLPGDGRQQQLQRPANQVGKAIRWRTEFPRSPIHGRRHFPMLAIC